MVAKLYRHTFIFQVIVFAAIFVIIVLKAMKDGIGGKQWMLEDRLLLILGVAEMVASMYGVVQGVIKIRKGRTTKGLAVIIVSMIIFASVFLSGVVYFLIRIGGPPIEDYESIGGTSYELRAMGGFQATSVMGPSVTVN